MFLYPNIEFYRCWSIPRYLIISSIMYLCICVCEFVRFEQNPGRWSTIDKWTSFVWVTHRIREIFLFVFARYISIYLSIYTCIYIIYMHSTYNPVLVGTLWGYNPQYGDLWVIGDMDTPICGQKMSKWPDPLGVQISSRSVQFNPCSTSSISNSFFVKLFCTPGYLSQR